MPDSRISRIPFAWPRPTSLAWDGDDLVDWLGGGRRWLTDGTFVDRLVNYAYDFDRTLVSPSGRYTVLVCERQTKGLILDEGRIVREIDRSYYQARAYAYPVALSRLADGREVIAHCPDAYNVLEIETLDRGKRITRRRGKAQDVFHSRLSFSPDGRSLLSAGWVWHPWSCFAVFDLDRVLADPRLLDREDGPFGVTRGPAGGVEVKAACWLDSARILVTSDVESADDPDDEAPCSGIWDVRKGKWTSRSTAWNPQASLYRCGGGVAYVEDGHPCWWAPGMDAPLAWPDIAVVAAPGRERRGIVQDAPLLAAHASDARFAVVTEAEIVVVEVAA
jgi:hypothetical protein